LWGQTFLPKAKNVAQVDLLLIVNQVFVDVDTTVGVFTDITQPPIATTQAVVAAATPGELRRTTSYTFKPPVPLEKRVSYAIGLFAPSNTSWESAFGDPYPRGQAVGSDGVPINPPADFAFTSHELK
jgi:hypothetical protein